MFENVLMLLKSHKSNSIKIAFCLFFDIEFINSNARVLLRQAKIIFAFSDNKFNAVCFPMPEFAPVIIINLFCKECFR
jgi:hypothetical protein